jgi:hypothetical protein
MTKLVFLLEEVSAMELLNGILPKILPPEVSFQCVPFEGKSDLEKNIPRKIKGWLEPGVRFVILRDQDSGDCAAAKERLKNLAAGAGRGDTLVRIACRELESWYLADLPAVEKALDIPNLSARQNKSKFRFPDKLESPSKELDKLTGGKYQKVTGSRAISNFIDVDNIRSCSFKVFVEGVRRIAARI